MVGGGFSGRLLDKAGKRPAASWQASDAAKLVFPTPPFPLIITYFRFLLLASCWKLLSCAEGSVTSS